jgi:hypothetical protein
LQSSKSTIVRRLGLIALSVAGAGCQGIIDDADAGGTSGAPHSDRAGIGLGTASQEIVSPSQVIDARRSVAVTETAILSQFTLVGVMNQLAAQNGNPGFTGTQLFRQLWETQNAAVGPADLQPSAHCSDSGTTLNGFPNVCRPIEGAQANAANVTNINSYSAIGLFNRFDLAPSDGLNCGEYRVVFGKTSGGSGRNFIIFEAGLANPRADLGIEGCRQVQAFWRDLSNNPDVNARATALRDFYFTGLPGFSPVIHMGNYGSNFANLGQIRINMFMQSLWDLKEFKLRRQCPGGVCALKMIPVTVKVNPFGDLFNPASPQPLASAFQNHFVNQVSALAVNDVNRFNYTVPDQFNTVHSDSQTGGAEDNYVANFAGASAFRNAIQAQLTAVGSALTPDQIVARAQALSCAGCHQRNSGGPVGGGITFPSSAFFVHNTESTEAGPDGTRFALSSGLTNTFLPFRKGLIEEFLSAEHPITTATRFNMVGVAADARNAYWVENRPSGSVVRASLNSGGELAIAFGRANPTAVATDGVSVYWTEAAGSIFKVSVNGGAITTLATGITGLSGIATDGSNACWTEAGSAIVCLPVGGGARTTFLSGRAGITGRIAIDGANVYWQEANNILKAPKATAAVSLLLTRAAITGLASDGVNLYLAENLNPGNILRISVGGGTASTVATGAFSLTGVAVGASSFVWTANTGPGAVVTKVKN